MAFMSVSVRPPPLPLPLPLPDASILPGAVTAGACGLVLKGSIRSGDAYTLAKSGIPLSLG